MSPPSPCRISYYFSPQGFATSSLYCLVPHFTDLFSDTLSGYSLCNPVLISMVTFPASHCYLSAHTCRKLWQVPLWHCASNTRVYRMLTIPRRRADVHAWSHSTDSKRRSWRRHGFAPCPTSTWAFFARDWEPHCNATWRLKFLRMVIRSPWLNLSPEEN